MKPWEFLIQKEGDRDWLAVTEPVVEIEAGNYRIIAQSHYAHLDVEVRLIYQKNSQRFYRRSNSEGLITILPGMKLQPGLWELHCYGDLMSELLGECRQENLQLKVFSKSTNHHQKPQLPSTNPKTEPYLQQLEQLLLQEIEPLLNGREAGEEWSDSTELFLESGDRLMIQVDEDSEFSASLPMFSEPLYPVNWEEIFDEPVCEPIVSELTTKDRSLTFAKLAAQELRIILDRETFARKKGEAIAISGRIETVKPTISNSLELIILDKLLYELRNPQTGEICIALVQSIGETSLPYTFEGHLEIPDEWEVALLIGTVILDSSAGLTAIRQPFLITTDLKEEVFTPSTRRVINNNELSRTIDYLLAKEAKSPSQHLDLPEPNKMNKRLQNSQSSSGSPVLPPQLTQETNQLRSLQLPPLPQLQKTSDPVDLSNPLPESETGEAFGNEASQEANQPYNSVEEAFDALPLKERFFLRLNALADPEKPAKTPDLN